MIDIFGIPNCDKVKKTLEILQEVNISYLFVDFKKVSPTKEQIINWRKHLDDWPVNKRGTTYRKFKDKFTKASDTEKIDLLVNNSSMIPRPIVEKNGKILKIGFDEDFLRSLK